MQFSKTFFIAVFTMATIGYSYFYDDEEIPDLLTREVDGESNLYPREALPDPELYAEALADLSAICESLPIVSSFLILQYRLTDVSLAF